MMTSPWAKFSILAIPYTIVYPSAMIAYTLPRLMPLIRCDKKVISYLISLYDARERRIKNDNGAPCALIKSKLKSKYYSMPT